MMQNLKITASQLLAMPRGDIHISPDPSKIGEWRVVMLGKVLAEGMERETALALARRLSSWRYDVDAVAKRAEDEEAERAKHREEREAREDRKRHPEEPAKAPERKARPGRGRMGRPRKDELKDE